MQNLSRSVAGTPRLGRQEDAKNGVPCGFGKWCVHIKNIEKWELGSQSNFGTHLGSLLFPEQCQNPSVILDSSGWSSGCWCPIISHNNHVPIDKTTFGIIWISLLNYFSTFVLEKYLKCWLNPESTNRRMSECRALAFPGTDSFTPS